MVINLIPTTGFIQCLDQQGPVHEPRTPISRQWHQKEWNGQGVKRAGLF